MDRKRTRAEIMAMYRRVVPINEVPADDLSKILGRVLDHLGLQIVCEETPDYTSYELQSKYST